MAQNPNNSNNQLTASDIRAAAQQLAAMNMQSLPLPGCGCLTCRQAAAAQNAGTPSAAYGYWPTIADPAGVYLKPPPVTLDTAKIDSLSGVEARKVQPKLVIPDLTTCLIGWRGWTVKDDSGEPRLGGLGMSYTWEPKKPVEAKCRAIQPLPVFSSRWGYNEPDKGHACPGKECSCGVWAFRSLDEFKKMAESYHSTVVVGQVYLWGRVLECENGYRAQYAYPKELWLFNEEHESLGWIYNCPIRTLGASK